MRELIADILQRYSVIGPYWLLFTYIITFIYMEFTLRWAKKNQIIAGNCILRVLLFFYLLTVYVSTVLSRTKKVEELVNLQLFWSWRFALSGNKVGIVMLTENLIMLLPIGVMVPFIIKNKNGALTPILWGSLFSLFIEMSQLVLHVGLFEVDDILNNTIGVIIGYVIAIVIKRVLQQLRMSNDIEECK